MQEIDPKSRMRGDICRKGFGNIALDDFDTVGETEPVHRFADLLMRRFLEQFAVALCALPLVLPDARKLGIESVETDDPADPVRLVDFEEMSKL